MNPSEAASLVHCYDSSKVVVELVRKPSGWAVSVKERLTGFSVWELFPTDIAPSVARAKLDSLVLVATTHKPE